MPTSAQPSFRIRLARPDDSAALAQIQVDSYRNSYTHIFSPAYLEHFTYEEQAQDWQDMLAAGPEVGILLVAELPGGEIAGYALGRPGQTAITPYDCELASLHVRRSLQKQGIGRALMAAMGQHFQQAGCQALLLWVLERNQACGFYEHLGGQLVGRQTIELGDEAAPERAEELAYGWPSLAKFLALNAGPVRGVIVDIDGVLTFQGQVYPGAVETVDWLRRQGMTLRFLTNSTLKSRQSAAEKLRQRGFSIQDDEVLTASYAAACYLRARQPRSAWVMVEGEGLKEFQEFILDEQNPEYIVVGDNRSRFDFDTLNKALRLLRKGAKLIGMTAEQLDTSMGDLELNVGSWVRMLELASGVPAVYIGKPFRYAFELALQGAGLTCDQVVMVGDRVSTDIRGANDLGMRSVLVKTGEFDPAELENVTARPDYVIDAIADLPGLKIFNGI